MYSAVGTNMKEDIMTQNGSFFSHIPVTTNNKRHLSLLSAKKTTQKNNTSRLQKRIRQTLGFFSIQNVYQAILGIVLPVTHFLMPLGDCHNMCPSEALGSY
ncbi:hypothetical protein XENOCAPTIV_026313 [Xenoophorus captivus]|uniref:Uncharacterized protein n=1 Tax=Xenoophorus captivus TaxID=1517983 RepID=A0ABV0RVA8_9TELE